ncbi:cell wall-binding repeat-containing protein [Planctomonas psychrotolerans]|uniref:cell wall-binding repeat-containing protein n=1 Tax=Planctomonas psychrotolerans TaxID=2528712 RepID=UPI00123A00B5|nr:cell wall-binding repeat-containing protein [Planctomonas psychrotolerans]
MRTSTRNTIASALAAMLILITGVGTAQAAPTPPAVDRVAGSDRYEGAAKISQRAYPNGARVVYVATGSNYPDALSAGAAAAKEGGPLLLTDKWYVTGAVRDEIARLKPAKIVVVGGTGSIADKAVDQLRALQPNTVRVAGANRFESSRAVVDHAFGASGSSTAYITTGGDFPDALSAGGTAGLRGAPVLLVNGGADSVDAATIALLKKLRVNNVKIVGGPNSVSASIEKHLAQSFSVGRLAGTNRFETSVAVNRDAFSSADRVLLATGMNFPDALAGSSWAGGSDTPLYVVQTECVPSSVLADIVRLNATKVTLLGGTVSLSTSVEALLPCSDLPTLPVSVATAEYIYPMLTRRVSDDFHDHKARASVNPGTDYPSPVGADIVAVKAGKVIYVQHTFGGSGGRMVFIDHGDSSRTEYLHMSRVDVAAGQQVAQGQRLGLSGASAYGSEYGSGRHLHLSLKIRGVNVDFEKYVGIVR